MEIRTCVLSSGSEGNCTYVETKNHKILLDVGVTQKYINENLSDFSISLSDIDHILITHVHDDHIKGLKNIIKKYSPTICVSKLMYEDLEILHSYENVLLYEDEIILDELKIEIIKTSHDTSDSRSFILRCNGKSLVYLTDTGYINQKYFNKLSNCNIYLFESNHDIEMLNHGPYPKWLKDRVIGDYGHLSNKASSIYLAKLIGNNTEIIYLTHLSQKNNTEDLALQTIKDIFKEYEIEFENIKCAHPKKKSEMVEI